MKNNSKRILALLLAIVMCVSCVVPVFAETTHNHDEHSTSALVEKTECTHRIDDEGTHIYVEGAEHLIFVDEKKPTCTEGGYKLYKCEECGTPVLNTSEKITEAGEHSWGETVVTEATCTTAGSKVTKCDRCGEEQIEVIDALDHTWSEGIINKDENGNQYVCGNENAYMTHTCTVCGLEEKVSLDSECKYGDPVFTNPPKCDTVGEATYTCEHCGNTKTVPVYPYGYPTNVHVWVLKGDYVVAPTCGTDGKGYAICKVCGVEYTNDTDNLYTFPGTATDEGHEFTVDVPAKAPTCAAQGYDAHKACKHCGKSEPGVKYYEATGHETLVKVDASQPDCENPGMKAHYICTVCGTYFDENKTETTKEALITAPALGHDYNLENDEPTVRFEPTCTKYGYDIYCCTKCGKLAEINGSEGIVKFEPLAHDWQKDTTTSVDPTCVADGVYHYTCGRADCGETKTEEILALGHDLVETHVEANCSTPAYTKVECTRCDYAVVENKGTEKDPTKHDLQTRITTPAPCGQIGVKVTYCANELCDFKPIEEQFTVEHEWKLSETLSSLPTCAAPGANVYECVLCGETKSESIDALEHVWPESLDSEYVEIIAPSCGQAGRIIYTCAACGKESTDKGEAFDPLNPAHHGNNGKPTWACKNPNHVYYVHPDGSTGTQPCDCHETTIYRPGNCYTYELEQYYCPVCDVRYHVIIEGTGPNYDENGNIIHADKVVDVPAQAPTCDAEGWTEAWHCNSCGEYADSTSIPKVVDHANKVFVEAKEDTCATVGNLAYWYCPDCGKYFVGDEVTDKEPIIDDIQHDYKYVAETCANGGIAAHYECSICGEIAKLEADGSYTKVTLEDLKIDIDHTNFVVDETHVNGTCTTEAYRHNICLDCGEEYIDLYRAAIGHNYVKVEAKDPDCLHTGNIEHYTCTGCGLFFLLVDGEYVETSAENVTIPTTDHFNGHEYFAGICTDKLEHGHVCVWCEVDYTGVGHSYKENIVAPTCEIDGYTVQICQYCNEHDAATAVILKATGHHPAMVEVKAPTVLEAGYSVYMCACGQYFNKDAEGNDVKVATENDALIVIIPALGGLNFSFDVDNAIYSGAEFVNGGKIKLTIFFAAGNVDLATATIRINYNADVLSYAHGDFDGKDEKSGAVVFNGEYAAIGGATPGFVVVTVNTFAFNAQPADANLYGAGTFATVYFNINQDVAAGSTFDFELETESALSPTQVLKADKSQVEATFDAIPDDVATKALADVDVDGSATLFDNADELEFLEIAFSGGYLAAADINQDGLIGSDDYELLRKYLIGAISYEDLCAAAQNK